MLEDIHFRNIEQFLMLIYVQLITYGVIYFELYLILMKSSIIIITIMIIIFFQKNNKNYDYNLHILYL